MGTACEDANQVQEECPRLWCIYETPCQPKKPEVIEIEDDEVKRSEVIVIEDDEENKAPTREQRLPWQLMGAFDDTRD